MKPETQVIISNPTVEPSWVRERFVGIDLASGDDRTAFVVAERAPDGTLRYEPVAAPTGFIECDGEPMAFWLPPGITPASINVTDINGGKHAPQV